MVLARIGITCNMQAFENRLSGAYVRAVSRAGAVPLLFPVSTNPLHWEQMLFNVDGLLLSGGGDPDAFLYGEEAVPAQGEVNPGRDRMELFLARRALTEDIPALGICRGAQILNVAAGGTLHQDLAGVACIQHDQKAPKNYPIHAVSIDRPSLLYRLVRSETIRVNSFHHQAVKTAGEGVRISARAGDEVVEALEFPRNLFALGVQWHPEWLDSEYMHARALFSGLVAAAKNRCTRRIRQK